jgi:hypothetical protein
VLVLGIAAAAAVVTMIVLAVGMWSPYWVASSLTRVLDRRGHPREARPHWERIDRAGSRAQARERLRAWMRNVNGRF